MRYAIMAEKFIVTDEARSRLSQTTLFELITTVERATLLDPGGARLEQVIEHRVDPLTGTAASINTVLGEKAKAFLGSADLALLKDLESASRMQCPFCSAPELCARPAFKANYANYDSWFAPVFVGDDAHAEAPEDYASKLRARW